MKKIISIFTLIVCLLGFGQSPADDMVLTSAKQQMAEVLDVIEVKMTQGKRGWEDYIHDILDQDVRFHVFEMEELAKTYSSSSKNKKQKDLMKRALKLSKALEDQIGQYAFYVEMDEFMAKWFARWLEEDELEDNERRMLVDAQELAKKNVSDEANAFYQWLKKKKWHKPKDKKSRLSELRGIRDKFRWPGSKKDRKRVLGYIVKKHQDIEKGIDENLYDPHEVELGIHELRRDIRRLVMLFQFMPGYINLVEGSENQRINEFTEGYKGSKKYFILRPMVGREPVDIEKQDYGAYVSVVKKLGFAKDNGQTEEYFTSLFGQVRPTGVRNGSNKKLAEKLIGFLPYEEKDFVKTSEETISFLKEVNLISRVREAIEAQL